MYNNYELIRNILLYILIRFNIKHGTKVINRVSIFFLNKVFLVSKTI